MDASAASSGSMPAMARPIVSPTTSLTDSGTMFSPEAHSWIMVPEADEGLPSPGSPSLASGEGSAAATGDAPLPRSSPRPLASSAPASPNMLQEAGGDLVAGLAVSEILSAESAWPLPVASTTPPPLPSLCGASYDEPPPAPLAGEAREAREARRLGALAFPPPNGKELIQDGKASVSSGATADAEDTESEADAIDELLDPLVCWGQAWARPLALVAVILASHAACLLLGVAIGKATARSDAGGHAAVNDTYLTRRFSSGATGAHARLCVA